MLLRPSLVAPSLCVAGTWSCAQAVARGATQVLDRGAHADSRGAARCASQVLDRGAQDDARGSVLDASAQAVARSAAHCLSK